MSTVPAEKLAPLVQVNDLQIDFDVDGVTHSAVGGISFEVGHGEVVAIVGESGSGKSVTALSLLGLLPTTATITGSAILSSAPSTVGVETAASVDLLTLRGESRRAVRGRRIAMVFQDPQSALNPVFTVGFQVGEAVRIQQPGLTRSQVRERVVELFELVEIPDAANRLTYYPHQLSGGQCQRIMIAMALAGEPELLIADEPTTALDVTVQAEILDVLTRMRARLSSSVLLITHDMGVVAEMADRVIVMKSGLIEEAGDVHDIFLRPTRNYTQELLAAVPRLGGSSGSDIPALSVTTRDRVDAAPTLSTTVFTAKDLVVEYKSKLRGRFRAVDGVDLTIERGEILALVGESGSGKTSLGMAAVGLAPISSGSIDICGSPLKGLHFSALHALRQRVGVVFQNPATSLNPRFKVSDSVAEPLRVHRGMRGAELTTRVIEILDSVGFGKSWLDRYPHELSGGQRQRVAIARAIALDPDVLIADEPTSALDVSVQAKVLDLFTELQSELGFACLFITHDLAVVDSISTRVAVMHRGKIVEFGSRDEVLQHPQHEYTRLLIGSVPAPDPERQRARRLERIGV